MSNVSNNSSKSSSNNHQSEAAADLIRKKLDKLYQEEPNAKEEIAEIRSEIKTDPNTVKMSKHQEYMKTLSESGRSLAEIQTAWHDYYNNLPDHEKHEVWQEFYAEHEKARAQKNRDGKKISGEGDNENDDENQEATSKAEQEPANPDADHRTQAKSNAHRHVSNNTAALKKQNHKRRRGLRNNEPDTEHSSSAAKDIKRHLISQVNKRAKIHKNPHFKAMTFGLGMGFLTLFILMFGFFNERFITPFIRPSTNVSATPIIVDPSSNGPVGNDPKIIIPKINVEAPVVYDLPSIQEDVVQKGLENGVVHYVSTPEPGEKGNAVIFGHSSSNILNRGNFKFAFLLLKSLENEDTFIIEKGGKRYVYKVYNKFTTSPTDFSVLGTTDKMASLTLITCDPPGTSTNRLIIQAEQIYPNPAENTESSASQIALQPSELPSNSVTLWQRFVNWL